MKAMKGLSMNRMMGSVRRHASPSNRAPVDATAGSLVDTPEANAARSVQSFCEAGGPGGQNGEEVLYLPTIVESAESSPAAASTCAYSIRKFLSTDNSKRAYVQYNAIMLMRILVDNPGPAFTKYIDSKFVDAVKALLRLSLDPSVRQILIETLHNFARDKASDQNLRSLMEMWKKEQAKAAKIAATQPPRHNTVPQRPPPPMMIGPPPINNVNHDQNYFARSHQQRRQLPTPHELAQRVEEARNSAKLLTQVVQSTSPNDLLQDELVREFADRCLSASRSMQGYMAAEEPPPDNDTMLTLIETNDQLVLAMSKHQRAILNARKVLGLGRDNDTSPSSLASGALNSVAPPPGPPPPSSRPASGPQGRLGHAPVEVNAGAAPQGSPSPRTSPAERAQNPFVDPLAGQELPFPKDEKPAPRDQFYDSHGLEPYHPGFNPTNSYVVRQDSAVGKITMHAGVVEAPDQNSRQELEGSTRIVEWEEEDDTNNVSPSHTKGPVYRY